MDFYSVAEDVSLGTALTPDIFLMGKVSWMGSEVFGHRIDVQLFCFETFIRIYRIL